MAKCEKCEKPVSKKVEEFSKDKYGKILCFDCQKTETQPTENTGNKTENKYQKDRGNKITRHGALNTAVSIVELAFKYGVNEEFIDGNQRITADKILEVVKPIAEDIAKWVKQ